MDNYYYYQSFRKTTVQFLDLFNGIKIVRYDRGGNFVKYVQVPIKYAPKEKIFFWLNERKDDEMLPIMSAALTGVDYSLERATNKHQRLTDITDGVSKQYLNPVPYDLSFSVSVWTLYMADIDQILEQILPWFQPYVMIRVHSPELNSTFDIKTIFSSATPEIDFEYTDDTFRILKYTLDFTVQTYMFKPMETVGVIKSVLMNYYTDQTSFNAGLSNARAPERSPLTRDETEILYQYNPDGTLAGSAANPNYGNLITQTTSLFTSGASGESQLFTSVPPWLTVDNDPIYDYELFSMGDQVGSSHASGGVEHINHDVRIQESSGEFQTWVPSAAVPSAGYWIDHDTGLIT